MVWVLFEERKALCVGHVLQEFPSYFEVDSSINPNKPTKIKKNQILFSSSASVPKQFDILADQLVSEIDIELLWSFSPDHREISVNELAKEYFGREPDSVQLLALWKCLWKHPIYFRKKQSNTFEKVDVETLEKAKAAILRKEQELILQQKITSMLTNGVLPQEVKQVMPNLLLSPDKNTWIYKAFHLACEQTGLSPEKLLWKLGAIEDVFAWHLSVFLNECFPKWVSKGRSSFKEYPQVDHPSLNIDLPFSSVQAFSIDDKSTTEVDDALSVEKIDTNVYKIGIHIAAPALAVSRGDGIDVVARERASTVYMPGDKITMLPASIIEQFSLDEGKIRPCVSVYAIFNLETGDISQVEHKVEQIKVAANLRLHQLEPWVDVAFLEGEDSFEGEGGNYGSALKILWKFAQFRQKEREKIRGKPETFNRYEFNFYVDHELTPPLIEIKPRKRGSSLDRLISELMIFANVSWGALVAERKIPMIYRSQKQGRVEMTIYPKPHETMGVPQYAWCTSPLRRYIDLVNQRQLICAIEQGVMAPLKAPYLPKDIDLYGVIAWFDARYRLYGDFQDRLERYWSLRWLAQEKKSKLSGIVKREDEVTLTSIPFACKLTTGLPIGSEVEVNVVRWDEMDLTLELTLANNVT